MHWLTWCATRSVTPRGHVDHTADAEFRYERRGSTTKLRSCKKRLACASTGRLKNMRLLVESKSSLLGSELAEHVVQDATVLEVRDLHRRVEAARGTEGLAVRRRHLDILPDLEIAALHAEGG